MTRRLISPRRWTPPVAPPNGGRTSRTTELVITRRLATGGHGPEDVRIDAEGRIVTGLADGTIVRLAADGGGRDVVGNTGGRPLGVLASADGSVLVCDDRRGLLRMATDGAVTVLADSVDGEPITFASNVVEGPDGTVWFTTSTSRWHVEHFDGDIIEHSCTGRLIRVTPGGEVTTLVDGLAFGNGLVLAPDGGSLLYAETAAYRVMRYWLTGPRAGRSEPFVDDLPGFPDNMSRGADGLLWVAMAAPRNGLLDRILPLPGVLRLVVWNLPSVLRPAPERISWVMAFDEDGVLVHDLRSTTADYHFVTAVVERGDELVLSSLEEDDVVIVRRPPRT